MAKVVTDDSHYKAIADKVREWAGEDNLIEDLGAASFQPSEMVDGVEYACTRAAVQGWESGMDEGYSEGYSVGYGEGHEEGYTEGRDAGLEEGVSVGREIGFDEGKAEGIEQGIQTEYDRFWDAYQQNGDRTDYSYGFGGYGWTAETFKPKHNLSNITNALYMFHSFGFAGDLAKLFEDLGVAFSLSNATNVSYLFYNAGNITRLPEIDISSAGTNVGVLFAYCLKLVTIDKLVVAANNTWANTFAQCLQLVNLTIEGTIGTSGLTLQGSTKLSKASITSVVNALSSTTSGLSVTFSKTAVNNAFNGGSTGAEWTALANTKSNWTINLV